MKRNDGDPGAPDGTAADLRNESESRVRADADQTAADLDQTHADFDQAAADADQQASDGDQRQAERDQHASDRDQAAADWDVAHSEPDTAAARARQTSRFERDAATRDRSTTAALRSRATAQRLATAERRDEVARMRDLTAEARDRTAAARDQAADARDRAAEVREQHALEAGDVTEAVSALRAVRVAGASMRRRSALERTAAARDRAAAETDRQLAAVDRLQAGLDELTGVYRRGAGELALTHEIARSRRFGQPLILAIFDVDGLKAVNDSEGHASGDALLRDVVLAITSTMRAYDILVRWGGDEFVCVLSDATFEVATQRVAGIPEALGALRDGASMSVGLAQLNDDDSVETLVGRADQALYGAKAARRG